MVCRVTQDWPVRRWTSNFTGRVRITGITVNTGPSGAPNLEECFDDLRYGLPRPPALAHRLDADTAGVLVLSSLLAACGWMLAPAIVQGMGLEPQAWVTLPFQEVTMG